MRAGQNLVGARVREIRRAWSVITAMEELMLDCVVCRKTTLL